MNIGLIIYLLIYSRALLIVDSICACFWVHNLRRIIFSIYSSSNCTTFLSAADISYKRRLIDSHTMMAWWSGLIRHFLSSPSDASILLFSNSKIFKELTSTLSEDLESLEKLIIPCGSTSHCSPNLLIEIPNYSYSVSNLNLSFNSDKDLIEF